MDCLELSSRPGRNGYLCDKIWLDWHNCSDWSIPTRFNHQAGQKLVMFPEHRRAPFIMNRVDVSVVDSYEVRANHPSRQDDANV